MWIVFLDEVDLPLTWPLLDHLLAGDGIDDQIVFVEPDKAHDAISGDEFRTGSGLVLQQTAGKV
jgi:hypothetical protein